MRQKVWFVHPRVVRGRIEMESFTYKPLITTPRSGRSHNTSEALLKHGESERRRDVLSGSLLAGREQDHCSVPRPVLQLWDHSHPGSVTVLGPRACPPPPYWDQLGTTLLCRAAYPPAAALQWLPANPREKNGRTKKPNLDRTRLRRNTA